jgi:hypothetical protein
MAVRAKTEDEKLERRKLEVTDKRLSPATRAAMTEDLQAALGTDSVEVPAGRPHVEAGERAKDAGPKLAITGNRLLILTLFGGGLLALGIALGAHAGWWFLPVVYLGVIAVGLGIINTVLNLTTIRDHPSATTAAAMEADGILNPDEYYSDLIREYEAPSDESSEDRTVHSGEQPAKAGAEQEKAMTPTGTPSKAVGPQ